MIKITDRRESGRLPRLGLWSALALAASVASSSAQPQVATQRWDAESSAQLLAYIGQIDRQGLVALDYAPDRLQLALSSRDAIRIEAAATYSFATLARDLAQGRIPPGRRGRYYIASDPLEPKAVADLIDVALAKHTIEATLDSLVPQNPQYRAMVTALARLPSGNTPERQALRVNLERQRWLPRELGADRLVVNIPEYTLHLFRDGREAASFRVIVGKPSTPTPRFSAQVIGVIVNPPWVVPQSIIHESIGKLIRTNPGAARAQGYAWTYAGGRLHVTQRPGPRNSLGQIKLDMPNPYTVYLHDTPSKALFDKEQRTFSHGCMRVDRPADLATMLLSATGINRPALNQMLEGRSTRRLPLDRPLPVYVIYQTVVADANGAIRYLSDTYRLDSGIAAQLSGNAPALSASATLTECNAA